MKNNHRGTQTTFFSGWYVRLDNSFEPSTVPRHIDQQITYFVRVLNIIIFFWLDWRSTPCLFGDLDNTISSNFYESKRVSEMHRQLMTDESKFTVRVSSVALGSRRGRVWNVARVTKIYWTIVVTYVANFRLV